jgi:hypothetical protein
MVWSSYCCRTASGSLERVAVAVRSLERDLREPGHAAVEAAEKDQAGIGAQASAVGEQMQRAIGRLPHVFLVAV